MAINAGKVIAGGLLAGLVVNVFDMVVNFTMLSGDMTEKASRLRLGPAVAIAAVMYGFTSIGVFTMSMFVKNSCFAIVSMAAGGLAGAWAYTEN